MILKNDQTNSNWKGVWYSSSDNTLKQGKFKDQKKVAVSLQEVWDGGEPEMMLEKAIKSSWWAFCQLKKGFYTLRKNSKSLEGLRGFMLLKSIYKIVKSINLCIII